MVDLAGLDPSVDLKFSNLRWVDFRNADLRNYNFTGADLRSAIKNNNTVIDESTIFDGADVDWIDEEAVPIVLKMQEVAAAPHSQARRKALSELVADFGQTRHVVLYLMAALEGAKTFEEVLDFAEHLPRSITAGQKAVFAETADKMLAKKRARSFSRTRRSATANLAMPELIERMKTAENSILGEILDNLATLVTHSTEVRTLNGIANLTVDDLHKAIANL
ncbi:MAG: pentapeptide repeat-containing protein [Pseudomonadota bacterium]